MKTVNLDAVFARASYVGYAGGKLPAGVANDWVTRRNPPPVACPVLSRFEDVHALCSSLLRVPSSQLGRPPLPLSKGDACCIACTAFWLNVQSGLQAAGNNTAVCVITGPLKRRTLGTRKRGHFKDSIGALACARDQASPPALQPGLPGPLPNRYPLFGVCRCARAPTGVCQSLRALTQRSPRSDSFTAMRVQTRKVHWWRRLAQQPSLERGAAR